MTSQGWSEGQALGARTINSDISSKPKKHHSGLATDAERLAAARVGILFKDDNLGLGAKRKGGREAVEDQRTGLDAFQGLLGRLNGKAEDILRKEEVKAEERKLEMFFRGRWGGKVFVRGGVLVGSLREGEKEEEDPAKNSDDAVAEEDSQSTTKAQAKEEKRQRKEERRRRREEKATRRAAKKAKKTQQPVDSEDSSDQRGKSKLPSHKSSLSQPPDEPVSSAPSEAETQSEDRTKKRKRNPELEKVSVEESENSRSSSPNVNALRNGRHLLRGRNIMAKRMVLADTKGLDQIFMR
jgi:Pin2-interacting protein X1